MNKLLFVDDDTGILDSINMVFKAKPNYKLLIAQSGQEAIQITKEENPDLIVLDMLMEDVSGEEVFKQLKELNPQINVIFSYR